MRVSNYQNALYAYKAEYAYQADCLGDDVRVRSPPAESGAGQTRLAGTVVDGAGHARMGHAWMGQGHGGQEQEQGQQQA